MNIILTKVVQTCYACPSQWDAWTADGQYLYMRYRSGIGTVEAYESKDAFWAEPDNEIACFGESGLDGVISLEEFVERAGLQLADDVEIGDGEPTLYAITVEDPEGSRERR